MNPRLQYRMAVALKIALSLLVILAACQPQLAEGLALGINSRFNFWSWLGCL